MEVISAPKRPVKKETENKLLELWRNNKEREPNRFRLANILGIVVRGAGNENTPFFRPHPGLFSLPSEDFPENKTELQRTVSVLDCPSSNWIQKFSRVSALTVPEPPKGSRGSGL